MPKIKELSDKYIMPTYRREIALVKGKGSRVFDDTGKVYLDFMAGISVNNLGYGNKKIVHAIKKQSELLIHSSNLYYSEPQAELAGWLAENSFGDKAFFCNSGAEAVEGAIKLARKFAKGKSGSKFKIVSMENSFHGRTYGALSATGQTKYQKGFEPMLEGFEYTPFNDLGAAGEVIDEDCCAVIVEPIQGEGGVNLAAKEFLAGLKNICAAKDALLIFDEIQCGMGRTGKLFAHQHYGIIPDVMVLAKSLGGGLPLGSIVAQEKVAQAFSPSAHASTFGGNPVSCAAALAFCQQLNREGFLNEVAEKGAYFKAKLEDLKNNFGCIREVRGEGLMIGMELDFPGKDLVKASLEAGLLINCANENVLRFLPPLTVSKREIDQTVGILKKVIGNR
ncbi:MAG: aspartate aminotransferase family protein [Candidatus Ratteibacteria bacterium]|nr:aspartate aminotransferase family protein [Candidatus Ratteibacteria bacterium]